MAPDHWPGGLGSPGSPRLLPLMEHSPAHGILLHLMNTLCSRRPACPSSLLSHPRGCLPHHLQVFFCLLLNEAPGVPTSGMWQHPPPPACCCCPPAWSHPTKTSAPLASFQKKYSLEYKVKVKLLSHVQLFVSPWTIAYKAPPSMGFSRQGYWSGLPFPSPGDLPNPGIEPGSPAFVLVSAVQ